MSLWRNKQNYPLSQNSLLICSMRSTLFVVPSASFGCIFSMVIPHCTNFRIITVILSGVRMFLCYGILHTIAAKSFFVGFFIFSPFVFQSRSHSHGSFLYLKCSRKLCHDKRTFWFCVILQTIMHNHLVNMAREMSFVRSIINICTNTVAMVLERLHRWHNYFFTRISSNEAKETQAMLTYNIKKKILKTVDAIRPTLKISLFPLTRPY